VVAPAPRRQPLRRELGDLRGGRGLPLFTPRLVGGEVVGVDLGGEILGVNPLGAQLRADRVGRDVVLLV
jgi:hypothetical protein